MANEALLHYKKLGIGIESDWAQGSITSATKLLPLRGDGVIISKNRQIIKPPRISGRASYKQSFLGTSAPKFNIPTFAYPNGDALNLLKVAFGQVSSAEVASFTVTGGSNDDIDFKEDGGGELTATLAAGTVVAGTSDATASSMCLAIKTALEAAGAGTYAVTYSTTTKKFTITVSGAIAATQFLPATGSNVATSAGALIGFTADTSSQASNVSDTAVEHVFDHTFTPLDALTYGLSAGMTTQAALATGKVFDVLDGVVDVLKFTYAPNQELWIDAECEARQIAASSDDLAALTEETVNPLLFSQLVFTVGGSGHELSGLEVSYGNNLKKDLFVNSAYRSKFPRNGFREVTGTFTMDLADSRAYAIYDAFLAGTQPALVGTFTGASNGIKTGFAYAYTLTLGKVQYNLEAVPGGGGEAAPDAPVPFMALDDGTNGELKVVVRNNAATVA